MIAIDTSAVGVMVKVTGVEVMAPIAAVMLLTPAATEVARPWEPAALLIVATDAVAETQVT